jgi:hypothetical protein
MAGSTRHGTWWDRVHQYQGPATDLMEGRFTRLFDSKEAAPARFEEADLVALAGAMTAPLDDPPTPEDQVDAEENPAIQSAYTYLGQFIDHDLTFDPTSHLREFVTDVKDLVDFRTPRFDLDNVYGRGPDDQPYLFQSDGIHLQLGRPLSGNPNDVGATDLARGPNGRALIGDPRNDENRIVAQLQATMLRFHNRVADSMPDASFAEVRQQVRWHYQWVVVNDFLPTIINHATVTSVFPHLASSKSIGKDGPRLRIADFAHGLKLMPVEFSVAAYRFGHSMIRPIYRLNETIPRKGIFSTSADATGDLGGFRPIPDGWGIDWQFFIDLDHGAPFGHSTTDLDHTIIRKPQQAYKIDTSLVNPLGALPASVVSTPPAALAARNLLRSNDFELPSGQTVAKLLTARGVPDAAPLPDEKIFIGKATDGDKDSRRSPTDISRSFAGNLPLWAYVLSEAQVTSWDASNQSLKDSVPIKLGPVGGRIVAEVFAALLRGDPTSYLNVNADFTPKAEFTHKGNFGLAELINVALGRTP